MEAVSLAAQLKQLSLDGDVVAAAGTGAGGVEAALRAWASLYVQCVAREAATPSPAQVRDGGLGERRCEARGGAGSV